MVCERRLTMPKNSSDQLPMKQDVNKELGVTRLKRTRCKGCNLFTGLFQIHFCRGGFRPVSSLATQWQAQTVNWAHVAPERCTQIWFWCPITNHNLCSQGVSAVLMPAPWWQNYRRRLQIISDSHLQPRQSSMV